MVDVLDGDRPPLGGDASREPLPTGIPTPCSTSSSMPFAARARSTPRSGTSSRMAAVSVPTAVMRSSSPRAARPRAGRPRAASVICWSACGLLRSAPPAPDRAARRARWRAPRGRRRPGGAPRPAVNTRGRGCRRAARRSGAPWPPAARRAASGCPSAAGSGSRCRRGRRPRWRSPAARAIRPANPLPTGISTPCSTSSSMPFAARAQHVAVRVEQRGWRPCPRPGSR